MTSGKLCVSVIEARNVQADDYADKNFYVRLRVGGNEIKTDIIKGTLQPKFLKDCRLMVAVPETDILRIELMQVGPRGDLVVGSDELRIVSITSKATIVHWFELKTSSRSIGAELCLVLRYLSADSSRPMSPSYAIAARQAKERALDTDPHGLTPSKAMFHDAPRTPTRSAPATLPPLLPASPAQPSSSPAYGTTPSHMQHNQVQQQQLLANQMQQQQYGSPRAPPVHSYTAAAGANNMPASPAVAPKKQSQGRGLPKLRLPKLRLPKLRMPRVGLVAVPLPVAMLCGAVVGAVVYSLQRKPVYYEVQEDDTLCHIAACYEKTTKGKRQAGKDLLRTPDIIYPGDRIRVR